MYRRAYWRSLSLVIAFCLLFPQVAFAEIPPYPTLSDGPADAAQNVAPSTRLIVELASPPLAVAYRDQVQAASVNGQLDVNAATLHQHSTDQRASSLE